MGSKLCLFEVDDLSTAIYTMSKKDTFNINVRTRMPEETFRIKDHESDEETADVVTPLQKEQKRKKKLERRK
jgi:uncharacterized membrane protein